MSEAICFRCNHSIQLILCEIQAGGMWYKKTAHRGCCTDFFHIHNLIETNSLSQSEHYSWTCCHYYNSLRPELLYSLRHLVVQLLPCSYQGCSKETPASVSWSSAYSLRETECAFITLCDRSKGSMSSLHIPHNTICFLESWIAKNESQKSSPLQCRAALGVCALFP